MTSHGAPGDRRTTGPRGGLQTLPPQVEESYRVTLAGDRVVFDARIDRYQNGKVHRLLVRGRTCVKAGLTGDLAQAFGGKIRPHSWKLLRKLLDAGGFWERERAAVDDIGCGARLFTLEGNRGGQYRTVSFWEGGGDSLDYACRYVWDLAELTIGNWVRRHLAQPDRTASGAAAAPPDTQGPDTGDAAGESESD